MVLMDLYRKPNAGPPMARKRSGAMTPSDVFSAIVSTAAFVTPVSERFSVERDTADMLRVILDREAQVDVTAVVQVKRECAYIGDLKTVDVSAVIIDD